MPSGSGNRSAISKLTTFSQAFVKGALAVIGGVVSIPVFYTIFYELTGLAFRQRHFDNISTSLSYALLGCSVLVDVIICLALRKLTLAYKLIFMLGIVLTSIICILVIMFSDMSIVDQTP